MNKWIAIGTVALLAGGLLTWAVSRPPPAPTYRGDAAAILYTRCVSCHRPGGLGPFPLLSLDDARAHAEEISSAVSSRYMPPWLPVPGFGDHRDSRRLTDAEFATLTAWLQAGLPEGSGPVPPLPPVPRSGFTLGDPDLILELPEPYLLPASGPDIYRNFVLPVAIEGPRWVRSVEVLPGNARVVHHAVLQIDHSDSTRARDALDEGPGYTSMDMGSSASPDGQLLIWTPGKSSIGSESIPWKLEPGTSVVLQAHLQTTGKQEEVSPRLGLYFTDRAPTQRAFVIGLHHEALEIAAGGTLNVERRFVLPVQVEARSVYAHAHYLGKKVEALAISPNGTQVPLLRIDDWDFAWQEEYRFSTPVVLEAGSTLVMRWVFDNTESNPRNPSHPPQRVLFGEQSKDEMASLWLQVVPRSPADRDLLQQAWLRAVLPEELEDHREMAQIEPENPARWVQLAKALFSFGRIPEALEAHRRAITLGSTDPFTRSEYANVLRASGQAALAASELEACIREQPNIAEFHSNLGVTRMLLGDRTGAMESYRRAIQLRPGYAEANFNLGNVLSANGQTAEAAQAFERALSLNPELAAAETNLGMLLIREGQAPQAVAHFRRVVELSSSSLDSKINLALALDAAGDRDGARAEAEAALTRAPNDPRVRSVAERLGAKLSKPRALGLRVENASEALLVASVNPEGLAAAAGIEVGDKILSIDGGPASQARLGESLKQRSESGEALVLQIDRAGTQRTIQVQLGAGP